MTLIEKIKTNYVNRLAIIGMILISSITLILLLENMILLIITAINLLSGIFCLIRDLLLIKNKAKIYSTTFKIVNYLGLLIVVILMLIMFIGVVKLTSISSFQWIYSLFLINILLAGFFQTLKRETLIITDSKIINFGLFDSVKMKFKSIDKITEKGSLITIQSINKDYIVINTKMTDPEQTKILIETVINKMRK